MHTLTTIEIWEADFVRSAVWWPYEDDETPADYEPLRLVKRFRTFEYLRMLIKLLPQGQIWRFPFGGPSDYGT